MQGSILTGIGMLPCTPCVVHEKNFGSTPASVKVIFLVLLKILIELTKGMYYNIIKECFVMAFDNHRGKYSRKSGCRPQVCQVRGRLRSRIDECRAVNEDMMRCQDTCPRSDKCQHLSCLDRYYLLQRV